MLNMCQGLAGVGRCRCGGGRSSDVLGRATLRREQGRKKRNEDGVFLTCGDMAV